MSGVDERVQHRDLIDRSWQRCQTVHHLERRASRPIMRLLDAEIRLRQQRVLDVLGDARAEIDAFERLAKETGYCIILADPGRVVVELRSSDRDLADLNEAGIVRGSCWGEQVAGTNGIQMAFDSGQAFTVRGEEHFYTSLSAFSCSSAPILDATNKVVAVLNMSCVDQGHSSDTAFVQHTLELAAQRIQSRLFLSHFQNAMVLSAHGNGGPVAGRRNALISVDDTGTIIGATRKAEKLQGRPLIGERVENVFGMDTERLMQLPERLVSLPGLSGRNSARAVERTLGLPSRLTHGRRGPIRIAPRLAEFALGSNKVLAQVAQAQKMFARNLPLILMGEMGTGRSMLARLLHEALADPASAIGTLDCTDEPAVANFLNQLSRPLSPQTLVIHQAHQCSHSLAEHLITSLRLREDAEVSPVRTVTILAHPIADPKLQEFYYLLRGGIVSLPSLRARDRLGKTIGLLADQIAGQAVEIGKETRDALCHHPWRGNLHELKAVLEQALICGNGSTIHLGDLPTDIGDAWAKHVSGSRRQKRAAAEARQIRDMLESTRWNVSEAARRLGIGRATINRKMTRYGLVRAAVRKNLPH